MLRLEYNIEGAGAFGTRGIAVRTLVTGASGFVGRALLGALARRGEGSIVATDMVRQDVPHADVEWIAGSLADQGFLAALMAERFDRIFHLATVAGVGSRDFDYGRATNLLATQALLEAARDPINPPRFVYASSVGIFGLPLPPTIDDETLPIPTNSYGTHKLVCELLISDYSAGGLIDGIALRLPGIVARPKGSRTMLSAFLSDVFYAARDGRTFQLPLAPDDGTWVMSLVRLIDNLQRAIELPRGELPARRYWTLPALRLQMEDLLIELAHVYGAERTAGISCAPLEEVRAMFAQVPLHADGAERLGMRGDGDTAAFVRNVISGTPALAPEEVF